MDGLNASTGEEKGEMLVCVDESETGGVVGAARRKRAEITRAARSPGPDLGRSWLIHTLCAASRGTRGPGVGGTSWEARLERDGLAHKLREQAGREREALGQEADARSRLQVVELPHHRRISMPGGVKLTSKGASHLRRVSAGRARARRLLRAHLLRLHLLGGGGGARRDGHRRARRTRL